MLNISYHLTQARAHLQSAEEKLKSGQPLSPQDAKLIAMLLRQAQHLQAASIQYDLSIGETVETLADKHRLSTDSIIEVSAQMVTDSINKSGRNLLELAPLAITDVRGERIVETMRKKIATGQRPGITVIGPHVTVRFNGPEQNMQSVSMMVVSVIDTAVEDEDEMDEGQ